MVVHHHQISLATVRSLVTLLHLIEAAAASQTQHSMVLIFLQRLRATQKCSSLKSLHISSQNGSDGDTFSPAATQHSPTMVD
jgi:hypothetical protein